MSVTRHHAEWLSLLEVSGPFLSMPVLLKIFPQGLDAHDPEISRSVRGAHEEWDDNQSGKRPNPAIHNQWVRFVLEDVLQIPEETIREGQSIPQTLKTDIPEHGETLRPEFAIYDPGAESKPRLLIQVYAYGTDLEKPLASKHWKATPATRMMELLHGTDCRTGLVTNGERWMLVDAPRGESTGFASWYTSLWLEEQITLRSFRSLLSGPRFFAVPSNETLEAMLAESAVNQQEVTEQLGYQVRQAVEVLVQSIDKADQDSGRALTEGVNEKILYEAALAVMMRLVFLMSAEERKLLLLGDPIYDQHYAISTLEAQLREAADQHGEEILEHRFDAWCRLLATFRAVHAGMQHDRMTLPAYGGHLFDPDRYPFLEGRKSGTSWKTTPAAPLPINNRTVLHALDALQFLQVKVSGGGLTERRRLSFRALDIEQIGHVYEGLLDHTAKRASAPILGLRGTKDKEPEIALAELEHRLAENSPEFYAWVKEETGRGETALKNAMAAELDGQDIGRFRAACGNDDGLWERMQPFASLVREDTFGYPVVILPGSVYVTAGEDRRTTGTQYTPRSLTGPVVQYTLEPLVYIGPAEGQPREDWKLRSAGELLDLKICDMACGSGAFLVETCRYLGDHLLEAWDLAEKQYPDAVRITPEGKPSTGDPAELLIPKDANERLIYARRLIAQQCLYGVDKNALAVEMAKLSLWLLTLERNRPFTFLDHAIKCGDSLLGVTRWEQVETFDFEPQPADSKQISFWKKASKVLVDRALDCRRRLEASPAMTVDDVEHKEELLKRAETATSLVRLLCDLLTGAAISTAKGKAPEPGDAFSRKRIDLWRSLMETYRYDENVESWRGALESMTPVARESLDAGNPDNAPARRPFHWPIEFPEVFVDRDGFDALLGNPPFMGGKKITGTLGTDYRNYLVGFLARGQKGHADLCAYFFLRACELLQSNSSFGLLATNTIAQGDTREVGLDQLVANGTVLIRATASRKWPGEASLEISEIWARRGSWNGEFVLDGQPVAKITAQLRTAGEVEGNPYGLSANADKSFIGSYINGMGFILSPEDAHRLIEKDQRNKEVLFPYLVGEDLNGRTDQSPSRWVINFFDWPLDRESAPSDYDGPVATDYPDCFGIVRRRVMPERTRTRQDGTYVLRRPLPQKWWIYADKRPALYSAIKGFARVLVVTQTSKYHAFVFVPNNYVYGHKLVVFSLQSYGDFAMMSSFPHIEWVLQYGSSLETRPVYTPSDCFETFPFPDDYEDTLEQLGSEYHNFRSAVLLDRSEGLTDLYNRINDPQDMANDICSLRRMQTEVDGKVFELYDWGDLPLTYSFLETKLGIRYTLDKNVKNAVLDRLLELNHKQHEQESALVQSAAGRKKKQPARKNLATGSMFE